MLDGKIYKQQIRKDEVFFITPPELAYDMAYCTMQIFKDNQEDIKFGEPTVGTGNLFLALRKVVAEEIIIITIFVLQLAWISNPIW